MQLQLTEVCRHVQALQSGHPAEAQLAGSWLAQLQRRKGALPLCLALLNEALSSGNSFAAFFAAQTLSARARLCLVEEAVEWHNLATTLLGILRIRAKGGSSALAVPALRQLCIALARTCVLLCDSWSDAVFVALPELATGPDLAPLLEFLEALAEEPFNRRFLVDGSKRSRFLHALREQTPAIISAVGEVARRQPGAPALRCAASWLRAQMCYEEWLPMIGFGGSIANGCPHPALFALAGAFAAESGVRAAKLELGLEALEGASQLLDAAIPLAGDFSSVEATTTVVPLLAAFGDLCSRLPARGQGPPLDAGGSDLADVVGVLLMVLQAIFSSPMLMVSPHLQSGLVSIGLKLLVLTGPCGGHEVDVEGGLLGRCFDAWESLAKCYRPNEEGLILDVIGTPTAPTRGSPSEREVAHAVFTQLLDSLPNALTLPQDFFAVSTGRWQSSAVRNRLSQLITVWCDVGDGSTRCGEALAKLSQLVTAAKPLDTSLGKAEMEFILTLGAAIAAAVASMGEVSSTEQDPPEPLGRLLTNLNHLSVLMIPDPWGSVLEAAAAEYICAMDPWISRFPVTGDAGRALLVLSFDLASSSRATSSSVEALTVVVSNFASCLAENSPLASECFQRLQRLLFTSTHLSNTSRERLVRSAIGPLVSSLPEEQLTVAVEALASPIRAAAPVPTHSAANCANAVQSMHWRLLFKILEAPDPQRAELSFEWLAQNWPWFEAAVSSQAASEGASEAACDFLTAAISRNRRCASAHRVLQQAVPLLVRASTERGSSSAMGALASVTRVCRTGKDNDELLQFLAVQTVEVARRLLDGGEARVQQLPQDLLAALLEHLVVALAPRSRVLGLRLLESPDALASLLAPVVTNLPFCASPRIVCWGVLLVDCVPQWLEVDNGRAGASRLLELLLPSIASSYCRLLASSPLVQDTEVSTAIAESMISLHKAASRRFSDALASELRGLGVASDEAQLLLDQLADPLVTDSALAEVLRDAAGCWRVEHLRLSDAA